MPEKEATGEITAESLIEIGRKNFEKNLQFRPIEMLLEHVPAERILPHLRPEERIAGLRPEEVLDGFRLEELQQTVMYRQMFTENLQILEDIEFI